MDNPFNGWTDDQIRAFIADAEKSQNQGQNQPPAQKARVKLSDGTVLEAENEEELSRLVQARFDAMKPRPVDPPQTPQNQPQLPKWDQKTFEEKLIKDAREGMEYYELANYGMPVGKTFPQLLAGMIALAQKVNALETESFAPKEATEREAVNEIIKARGWQPSKQAYEDALMLAKATGRIKAAEDTKVVEMPRNERGQFVSPGTFIPPRIPRTTGESDQDQANEDLMRAAYTMPLDKLRDLLANAGVLKGN